MSRRCSLLLLSLLVVVLAPFPSEPASASCAGPELEDVDELVLVRGGTVTVRGSGFVDGCRDSMSCGSGACSRCEYDEPPEQPRRDVVLEVRQGGRSWRLGTADAGTRKEQRMGQVTWTVDVPDGLRRGRARLVPEGALPFVVQVR